MITARSLLHRAAREQVGFARRRGWQPPYGEPRVPVSVYQKGEVIATISFPDFIHVYPRLRVIAVRNTKSGSSTLLNFLEVAESSRAAPGQGQIGDSFTSVRDLYERMPNRELASLAPDAAAEVVSQPDWQWVSTCRSPYTRLVSVWLDKVVSRKELDHLVPFRARHSFRYFVDFLHASQRALDLDPHWAPQTRILSPWVSNRSRILRLEQLDSDLSSWAHDLITADLGDLDFSIRDHATKASSSVDNLVWGLTRKKVNALYAADFEVLNYKIVE